MTPRMHTERTPNPHSVKWVLDRALMDEGEVASFDADTRPAPEVSPLAARLLAIDGVERLLVGADFVTVSRSPDAGWRELGQAVTEALRAWAEADEPVLGPGYARTAPRDDAEVVGRIRRILDEEIGPYVAQDGGDVRLEGFDDGVVSVRLQGACQSCPSSTITLKMGIEARLREAVPEVRRVVAVEP